MKMTEMEIVKRAIENTEKICGDMIKECIQECIQDEEILDDLDYYLGANGTSLTFEKNTYDLQNIIKLKDELSKQSFIEWIKVVVKDNTVSLDVAYKHDLSMYGSVLFKNYVYAKLDYGF